MSLIWTLLFVGLAAAANSITYDTTAGELYARFGRRPFEEQPIPLATFLLSAKSDIQAIHFHQGENPNCLTYTQCERNPASKHLWIWLRFKDNSQARIELKDIEKQRIDYLYELASIESVAVTKVITYGASREPLLVKLNTTAGITLPTLRNPSPIADTIGYQLIRIYESQYKPLSREIDVMVTTTIRGESIR